MSRGRGIAKAHPPSFPTPDLRFAFFSLTRPNGPCSFSSGSCDDPNAFRARSLPPGVPCPGRRHGRLEFHASTRPCRRLGRHAHRSWTASWRRLFPRKDFSAARYGATADGRTDCSAAIARAIEACSQAGGGRVVLPAGVCLAGPIHLKSNVNLFLPAGTTIRFTTDPARYLPVARTRWEGTELMNYSALIGADGQENIAVTGEGTLDGGAGPEHWWPWTKSAGAERNALVEMGAKRHPRGATRIRPGPSPQAVPVPAPRFPQHPDRGRHREEQPHVADHAALLLQRHYPRGSNRGPRAQQRRLRPGFLRRCSDRQLLLRHRRRLHRHQERPQPRRAAGGASHRERGDPRMPHEGRPRRRHHRQRDVRRRAQRVRGGLPHGQPQSQPCHALQDQRPARRRHREHLLPQPHRGRSLGRGPPDRLPL